MYKNTKNCDNPPALLHQRIGAVVKDIAICVVGLDSIPGPVKSGTVSPLASHRCDVFRSYAAQALSRAEGPRHSLHVFDFVSTYSSEDERFE